MDHRFPISSLFVGEYCNVLSTHSRQQSTRQKITWLWVKISVQWAHGVWDMFFPTGMKQLEFDGCFNPAPRPNRPRYCPGHPTCRLHLAPHGSSSSTEAGTLPHLPCSGRRSPCLHEVIAIPGPGGSNQLSCLQGHPCQTRPCPPPHQNQLCTKDKRLRSLPGVPAGKNQQTWRLRAKPIGSNQSSPQSHK